MSAESTGPIRVVVLDRDERFRTLIGHHITTAWPDAVITDLASLGDLDVSAKPDCFVLDHETLQEAAQSADKQVWFRTAAVVASAPCVIVAEPSDELLAVRYMKGGARDFLPKRLIRHELIVASLRECLDGRSLPEATPVEDDECAPTRSPGKARPAGQPGSPAPARSRRRKAARPATAGEQPVEAAEPVEARPVEAQPVEAQPVEAQPVEAQPVEARSVAPQERPAQPTPDEAAPRLPGPESTLEGYRLIRRIASGGVASVHLAYSEKTGHDVALKVLRVAKSNAANKYYERFEQEYRLVSGIDSPSVVKSYDFGRTRNTVFIAFEYFPCGDLKTRLRERVSPEVAEVYLGKIAAALQELHALEILHRDLKPANVMLREDDSVALIDFGMAKQLQSAENLTLPGTVQGTPHYLSPEQAAGRVVDERSDIYSLGVIFYEMLEGKRAYAGKTPLEVCMAHLTEPVPTLSPENAGHQLLLDWMMCKELGERCATVKELREVLNSKGVNATPAAAAGRFATSAEELTLI